MASSHTRFVRQAIAAVLTLAALALPAAPVSAQESEAVWPKLTPRLQELVQQEMLSILDASRLILDALVMGDDGVVAEQARAIERSFIMEQSMTAQDRQDLMAALPPAFVELDQRFHQTAADLAAAAERSDRVQARTDFHTMVETCIACHTRFATDRFPTFDSQ